MAANKKTNEKKASKLEENLMKRIGVIKDKTISPTQALMASTKEEEKNEQEPAITTSEPKEEIQEKEGLQEMKKTASLKKATQTIEPSQSLGLAELFQKPPRLEDTHTRRTFFIRNDLLERLDNMDQKIENFNRTKFINYLLERGLDELEKNIQ